MRYFLLNKRNRLCTLATMGWPLMLAMTLGPAGGAHASETDLNRLVRQVVADAEVTGKVTGEASDALPGVSILIKGTTRGTIADENGNFRISVPDNEQTVLVFSLVGYASKEVMVGNQKIVNVSLAPDHKVLEEVVVVGYGTQRKRDVTGSVVSVSESTLKEVPAPNLVSQLKGRAAGVSIISNGSTPGFAGADPHPR